MRSPARSRHPGPAHTEGHLHASPPSLDAKDAAAPQPLEPLCSGTPLKPALRAEMEARFGADFGAVRVHTDGLAQRSADAQLARAYTIGPHIVFNQGRYAPHTGEGRQLLAHELAHVVQQTQRGDGAASSATHEQEAEAAATAATSAQPASVSLAAAPGAQATPLSREEIARLDMAGVRARIAANESESQMMVLNEEGYAALAEESTALTQRFQALNVGPATEPAPGSQAAGGDDAETPPEADPGPTGRPHHANDARNYAVRGVREFGGEVPFTDGSGGLSTLRVGPYILGPNAIQCEDGQFAPLYYVAYHVERQRNEWIVGPDAVGQFRSEQEARNTQSEVNADAPAPEFPPSIPLHARQAQANEMHGIQPHFLTESVPRTSQEGPAETAGPYDLIPHQVNTADGQVVTLYYTARDRNGEGHHDQWVIGPDAVAEFRANPQARYNSAVLAYTYGPPHAYEAESTRWVTGAMAAISGEGSWSDAFGHLGNAWSSAVRDPKWQVQALASHVPVGRALGPLAQVVRRRAAPYVAAGMIGLENAVPAVRAGFGGSGSAIVQMEGRALAAEVQQVAAPTLQAGVNEAAPVAVQRAAPALAGASSQAAPGVGTQVLGAGLQSAAPQAAVQGLRTVDPAIDQAVERGIVEEATVQGGAQTPRPPRVPRSADATTARSDFGDVRNDYAQALSVALFGQVHHAIEVQVLSRYPGVYTPGEINQFQNMRGIPPELQRRTQLHNSKIREILDRHYVALDAEIQRLGLQPGTPEYNQLVRQWLDNARAEIDWSLGQFFSEQRALLFPPQ
jgi:hypothetical protein